MADIYRGIGVVGRYLPKMEIWKQVIMQEVGHHLQTIKESAEAQKECFRVEMEELRGQLHEMEM